MPEGTIVRMTKLGILNLAVLRSSHVGEQLLSFIHSFGRLFKGLFSFMLTPAYHSGISLNVTSLGKPLTSEARLGLHITLSWSTPYFPFHRTLRTYNNWLTICFPSPTIISVTAKTLPVSQHGAHRRCSINVRICVRCWGLKDKLV